MPRHRPLSAVLPQARTQRNIRTPINDWSQEKWQLRWTIAVISVEKHDYVRAVCSSESGQTGATVSAARFLNYARSHSCGDLGRSVTRVAINDDDLGREIRWEIRQDGPNRF